MVRLWEDCLKSLWIFLYKTVGEKRTHSILFLLAHTTNIEICALTHMFWKCVKNGEAISKVSVTQSTTMY